jgi:ABC-type transport system involved in cytochrome c biogenesis permease subunit
VSALAATLAAALAAALLPASLAAAAAGWAAVLTPARRGTATAARALGGLTTALALAAWTARWAEAGHLPLFGTWESTLSLVLAVCAATAAAGGLGRRRARLWGVAGVVAAALLAHGLRYDPTVYALTISERSWVVDVHAVLAWAAFGALTVNAAVAAGLLLRRRAATRGARDELRPRHPALGTTLSLGFLLHTAMLVSGSVYKLLLFGRVWSFDPIESLGLVAWVAYGTLLHLHLMGGWEGRRLARGCLGLFVLLVISYRGIVYFPAWSTYHIFDMDLRIHVTGTEGG